MFFGNWSGFGMDAWGWLCDLGDSGSRWGEALRLDRLGACRRLCPGAWPLRLWPPWSVCAFKFLPAGPGSQRVHPGGPAVCEAPLSSFF